MRWKICAAHLLVRVQVFQHEDPNANWSREESLWLSLFAVSFLLPRLRHELWMMKIWRVRSPMILLEMTEGQHECLRHFAQDSRSPEILSSRRLLKCLDPRFCLSEIHGLEQKKGVGSFGQLREGVL